MIDRLKQAAIEVAAKLLGNENWRQAYTLSGQPAGFSFFCPRCKLGIPYNAGEDANGGVFHCGALQRRPTIVGNAEQQKAERMHRVRFI